MLLLLGGCAGGGPFFRDAGTPPQPAPLALAAWPDREVWTGVVFNGERIGFARRELRAVPGAPGRYEIESEAAIRLKFLGIDKRINLRSLDRVRDDLTLESFRYEHEIDGSRLQVEGRLSEGLLAFTVKAAGGNEERRIPVKGKLYPSSAMALLPPLQGMAVGRQYRYPVFHGETQTVAAAEQDVQAWETSTLFEGAAFRVATRLLGLDTTTWLDARGRPVFELGLRGVMISALEDEPTARRYLVEATLNKQDALVDFSLVRAGPLPGPRRLARMAIAFESLPGGFTLPSEGGQRCGGTRCVIDRAAPLAQGDPARYLRATLAAPSNLGEVVELSRKILQGTVDVDHKISNLLLWMDANIAKEAVDAFTAVDVLRNRRAECQGHAYLFAALARAAGIPTRIVNGLAYSEAHGGFLFHTWNEAWIAGRGWRPVDATFGQPHADATHLKLLEGESPGELLPLVGLIGRLRVAAVGDLAHW
jgi:hypothetical protein